MTTQRVIKKQLAGQEDILYGEGSVSQSRNGGSFTINKVRQIYPVNSIAERDNLDTDMFTKCRLYNNDGTALTDYEYTGAAWVETKTCDDSNVTSQQSGTGSVVSTVEARLAVLLYVEDFGAVGDTDGTAGNGTDDTTAFKNAIAYGESIGQRVQALGKKYRITDTLTITSTVVEGQGPQSTWFFFDNTTADKVFIDISDQGSHASLENLWLWDVVPGTSKGVKLQEYLVSGGLNSWKNQFNRVRVEDFKVGFWLTTPQPLVGTTASWASETIWLHCKIKNCRTGILNQNHQAVNNTLLQTDIENDDVGENYTMIRDEAGGGFNTYGGSFIGHGYLYDYILPVGGTTLWTVGYINVHAARLECLSGHNGVLFNQNENWSGIGSATCKISMTDSQITTFGQELDLLKVGGRTVANFNNIDVHDGKLFIHVFPTDGFTSSGTVGATTSVNVTSSNYVYYKEATTSPYGTYSNKALASVDIDKSSIATEGQASADADGFISIARKTELNVLSRNLSLIGTPKRLVYNDPSTTAGFTSIKAVLPEHGRPTKLFIYKHPQRFGNPIVYKLYIVKDKADWAGGTFAVGTDAELVATATTIASEAGYYEDVVTLTANVFGVELKAGQGSWLEGRIYLEHSGSASSMIGFVGVEYI